MSAETALVVIAEIGAGFTGFVALVSVFFGREERLKDADRLHFRGLMALSVTTTLVALGPLVLATTGLVGPALWRVSSIVTLVSLLFGARFQRRAEKAADPSWARTVGPERWISWSLVIATMVVSFANATGVAWTPFSGAFVVSTYALLAAAAAQFVALVVQRLIRQPRP